MLKIGVAISYFAYRQYYPSLIHAQCQDPFALRTLGSVDIQNERLGRVTYDDEASVGTDTSLGVTTMNHEPYRDHRSKPPSPVGNGFQDRY